MNQSTHEPSQISYKQCMKWPVAHSPNSTWFWLELVGNCRERLEIIMGCTNIQFCEWLDHGWQFHPLYKQLQFDLRNIQELSYNLLVFLNKLQRQQSNPEDYRYTHDTVCKWILQVANNSRKSSITEWLYVHHFSRVCWVVTIPRWRQPWDSYCGRWVSILLSGWTIYSYHGWM